MRPRVLNYRLLTFTAILKGEVVPGKIPYRSVYKGDVGNGEISDLDFL